MYHIPDKASITKQLRELGYENVPDEVLNEFVNDLKKLYKEQALNYPATYAHTELGKTQSSPNRSKKEHAGSSNMYSDQEDYYQPPAIHMQSSENNAHKSIPLQHNILGKEGNGNGSDATHFKTNTYTTQFTQPKHGAPNPHNHSTNNNNNIYNTVNTQNRTYYDEEVDYADFRVDMYEFYPPNNNSSSNESNSGKEYNKDAPHRPAHRFPAQEYSNLGPPQRVRVASTRPSTAAAPHRPYTGGRAPPVVTCTEEEGEVEGYSGGEYYSDYGSYDEMDSGRPDPSRGYLGFGAKPNSIGVIWARPPTSNSRKTDPVARFHEVQRRWSQDPFLNAQKKNKNPKLLIPHDPPYKPPHKDLSTMRPNYVIPSEKRRDNLRFEVRAKMAS